MPEEEEKSKDKKRFGKEFVEKWTRTAESEKSPEEVILEKQKKLLEKNPNNARVWYANGLLLMDMMRNEEALSSLERAASLEPDYPGLWNARAEVLKRLGRNEEAAEALKKALEYVAPKVDDRFLKQMEKKETVEEILGKPEGKEPAPEEVPEEIPGVLEELEALGEEVAETEEVSAEEKEFRVKIAAWEAQGFDVTPLREVLENEPYKARTAFFQFEQNVAKIAILKQELDNLKAPGFEEDIQRLRDEMRSPSNMWKVEADMGDLLSRIDTGKRAEEATAEQRREAAEAAAAPIIPLPTPPGPQPPSPRPFRPAKAPPLRPAEGMTNGRIAGKGRVNGLGRTTGKINGTGKTNGLVNGLARTRQGLTNGLTNGNGFTNGLGSPRFRRDSRTRRWKVLIIPVLAVLLLMIPLFSVPMKPMPPLLGGVTIDGNPADWSGVPGYNQTQSVPDDNVNLESYKMLLKDDLLSFLAEVKGTPFISQSRYESFYAFVDADGVATTGYNLGGFGADYLIEISGTNGSLVMGTLSEFDSSNPGGSGNWSAWSEIGGANRAFSGGFLEFQVDTRVMAATVLPLDDRRFQVMLETDNNRGVTVHSAVRMGADYGALIVHEQGGPTSVPAGQSEDIFTLVFEAVGSPVHVNQVDISASGLGSTVTGPANFDVSADQTVTRTVSVDTRNAAGALVGLEVSAVDADRPVTIVGEPARAYVGAVPAGKTVDGIFSDWSVGDMQANTRTVWPNSLDIANYSTNKTGAEAFFYADVRGTMMAGSDVVQARQTGQPSQVAPPAPGQPGLVKGLDVMRVYVDSNSTDNAGYPTLGLTGADYMIEVRGIHGRIIQRIVYAWRNGRWQQPQQVQAEKDEKRMEIGLDLTGITVDKMQVAFESSNWRSQVDYTTVTSVRSRTRGIDDTTYETLYGARLPNELGPSSEVTFTSGSYSLKWTLPSEVVQVDGQDVYPLAALAGVALDAGTSQAEYHGAYPAMDMGVSYVVDEASLKEQFVINTPVGNLLRTTSGTVRFTFKMTVGAGLMTYINGSGPQEKVTTLSPISFMTGSEAEFSIPPAAAWDSGGRRIALPYTWETAGPKLSVDVPVSFLLTSSYPVYVDPWVNYTFNHTSGGTEYLGNAVAIGDFNGDGYADLLAGAYGNSTAGSSSGAAYIYLGPLTTDKHLPDVRFPGTTAEYRKGYAVAAGKFDSDSYWDALVTQGTTSALAPSFIYSGRASWPSQVTTPDVTINPPSYLTSGAGFGGTAAAGNFDNANYDDIVLGAQFNGTSNSFIGVALVFLSPFSSTVNSANFALYPPNNNTNQLFGSSVATGFIDSDSKCDIVVGGLRTNSYNGRVSYFKGSSLAGILNHVPNAYLDGSGSEQFGKAVAVGKLDSDSYEDVAVGAPGNSANNGKVYLYLASPSGITTGQSASATVTSQSTTEQFGYSILIGPVLGTGTYDLVVGAPFAAAGGTNRGRVYVFDSPLTSSTPTRTQSGDFNDDNLGRVLAGGVFANDNGYRIAIGNMDWAGNAYAGRVVILTYIPEFPDVAGTAILVAVMGMGLGMKRRKRRRDKA